MAGIDVRNPPWPALFQRGAHGGGVVLVGDALLAQGNALGAAVGGKPLFIFGNRADEVVLFVSRK